jgi:hypothetical protein
VRLGTPTPAVEGRRAARVRGGSIRREAGGLGVCRESGVDLAGARGEVALAEGFLVLLEERPCRGREPTASDGGGYRFVY